MTDTNLDRAAKMAGYDDWREVGVLNDRGGMIGRSIRAHAATLEELASLQAQLAEARELIRGLAAMQTVAEVRASEHNRAKREWTGRFTQEQIDLIAQRKEEHDARILAARKALGADQ